MLLKDGIGQIVQDIDAYDNQDNDRYYNQYCRQVIFGRIFNNRLLWLQVAYNFYMRQNQVFPLWIRFSQCGNFYQYFFYKVLPYQTFIISNNLFNSFLDLINNFNSSSIQSNKTFYLFPYLVSSIFPYKERSWYGYSIKRIESVLFKPLV